MVMVVWLGGRRISIMGRKSLQIRVLSCSFAPGGQRSTLRRLGSSDRQLMRDIEGGKAAGWEILVICLLDLIPCSGIAFVFFFSFLFQGLFLLTIVAVHA